MRAIYLVAGAALAITGCEKAAADRVEASKTTIDDRGARPQYLLRYDIPKGFAQRLDAVMDLEMSMSGAQTVDMTMPRMIMAQAISVDDVDARGAMHVIVDTDDIRVEDDGSHPGMSGAMRTAMKPLEDLTVTANLLPDGRTRGMKMDLSSLPADARQQVGAMEQAIQQMVAVLPDVAVGEGARWTVEQTIRMSNMRMVYTLRYEVLAISEDHATLHIDMDITAPPQNVVSPQGSGHLDGMTGTGAFDMEIDLHRMVERVTGGTTTSMSMSGGGQEIELDMRMGLQVLPAGDTPAPRN